MRLSAEGTRVVILRPGERGVTGIITEIRSEPHLRPYVVICDDGAKVFASPYDLCLEGDTTAAPLGPRPYDD